MRTRLFIGLNPSVAVVRRVAEAVERRRARAERAQVAWVPAANFHVTLRFIGGVEDELVEGLAGRLRPLVARRAPFELKVAGFGAFPAPESGAHPRVLWVGVDGGEPLLALQREVEAGVQGLGLPGEERTFHPHLTVGRVKDGEVPGWAGELDIELGRSLAQEIVIYESRTLAQGAEYVARARLSLGGA